MEKIAKLIKCPAISVSGLILWVLGMKLLLVDFTPTWRLWAAGIFSVIFVVLFVDLDRC